MLRLLRKKYLSFVASGMVILLSGLLSVSELPILHNLNADLNIWNVKSFIILEGEHHHEPNPESACFDFHTIKIIDIGECLGCQIVNNFNFQIIIFLIDFCENVKTSNYFVYSSLHLVPQYYNLSLLRAPPII